MLRFENRALKAIATGTAAIVLVTASLLSATAAPTAKAPVHAKIATTKGIAAKKAPKATVKKAIFKTPVAKKPILKAVSNEPTVLEDIVIEKTPKTAATASFKAAFAETGSANPAFRRHFFRGQAGIA